MQGLLSQWKLRLPSKAEIGLNGRQIGWIDTEQRSSLISSVIAARGLNVDSHAGFLNPRLSNLHDPVLLHDMDRACMRILEAIERGEPVVIYGDYDTDGVCAAAIVYHTLVNISPRNADRIRTYIPHRIEEGYGLNEQAIEQLAAEGAKVIVTVDCGITAAASAARARMLGVDLIITDHHNPPKSVEDLPRAYAMIHPRDPRSAQPYPFADLCGAGVAYKLAWRLCTLYCGHYKVADHLRILLIELLGLASLGVIADVVPMLGENRIIAAHGLARIPSSSFIGLRALVEASGLSPDAHRVEPMDVGFKLAPRLNAAGRLGHAREALELFTTDDAERAAQIAASLTAQNDDRRKVEKRITEQAIEMAHAAGMTDPSCRAIVLAGEEWHAGVVGIACSRLVDRFRKPTILLAKSAEGLHGSGRSIEGFSLHAALDACSAHLTKFGGHDMAAGLALAEVKLPDFISEFTAYANQCISDTMMLATNEYDADVELQELTLEQIRMLDRLSPHGKDHPEPLFRLMDARVSQIRPMGAGGKHLSFLLSSSMDTRGTAIRTVAWDWARVLEEHGDPLRVGAEVEVLVHPRISTYTGTPRVECELRDLRIM